MDILKMHEDIFKISKNSIRAKAILELAEERREATISLVYIDGYKTLSHKLLIEYMREHYNKFFSEDEFILLDRLRILRNEIVYYGKKVSKDFLMNNEEEIKSIMNKLIKFVNKKLR